ncbi:hypothetical protein L228DRAFT_254478 [Xylona heveae TC161]|uniref:Probable Xaa-Pro aminopeptidase P n=1 Tax=Xylona heveae (strain CBS 132557 / TC161) TaxID=1328760 RepID=A0A164ZK28_XYLHT|nr:hypothetical protein L228DRAFT_254478 [Xylona heveae TC161]KZF19192.1 hypothetical protein L228DRAFT_254478 [Xylona heveae TC161]
MEQVNTSQRLAHLRELMKKNDVDIYIVPSEDSHQSEYIAPCDARREFISGFTGSAGCAVVTLERASLATDGRYFNQAEKQLDDNWELLKQGLTDVPTWQEWTADQSAGGKTVGVDPTVITAPDARKLSEKIKKKGGKDLVGIKHNLVDQVWGEDRPARPNEPVRVLGLEFAGKPFQEKLGELRKELDKKKSAGFIVSMLDEIAWFYNLRGSDIPYNPVFFSYALVTPTSATLYIDSSKIDDTVRSTLGDQVEIRPYEDIFKDAEALGQTIDPKSSDESVSERKFMVASRTSWALIEALGGADKVQEVRSPITDAKAIKNETELNGMRACHIRDGAALTEYFAWLEEQLVVKGAKLDEVQAADKLEAIRSKHHNFVGLSFDTISSTGPNAAVIHYSPERGNCDIIDPKAIYLCDSGAQYLDGTTDTTRTLHFGEPTEMERKAYTLVLKGNIALDRAVFPKGTTGFALDTLARQFLWEEGLDYRHGTGHGVGSYLNVHEGPIGIGTRVQYSEVSISAGNVISDEPGYYEDGKFGVRIENVVAVREASTEHQFGDKPYLCFETMTMVPMCRKLIDVSLLTDVEKSWLNFYHAAVYEKTKGFFEGDERTLAWLERETQPRERRPGGYGGLGDESAAELLPLSGARSPHLEPTAALSPMDRPGSSRGGWNEYRNNGQTNGVNGTGAYGDGPGSRQIEDVLQQIQRDWNFMTKDDCLPVQVALQLLDTSSLGRAHQYDNFQLTHQQLQSALKAIVNDHHQGFNSSIGTFHKIQSSIQASQGRIRTLRDSLVQAKTNLSSSKPELKDLATSSQKYEEMLQVLGRIEQLQLVPEKLEARISEKRFLAAVDVLQDGLRLIRRTEMENIRALSDLKVYLNNQHTSLTDILVEELHNHLYLKSPYCQDRWRIYAEHQGKTTGDDPRNTRPVYVFLDAADILKPMTEDASRNPEADTFYYIHMIVDSLNRMGRLDVAIDRISQRLPVELFKVVDKTNKEVDQRHPSTLRGHAENDQARLEVVTSKNDVRATIMNDFLSTLYAKFEAIAEGHRAVHHVVSGIVSREGIAKPDHLMSSFKELWKLYQSEMRSILHDYLATDSDVSYSAGAAPLGGIRYPHRIQRDRSKRMFKLSDMDNQSTQLTTEQEDLEQILKSSVPGLVSDSRRPAGASSNEANGQHEGGATGHKLLIEPSVFNMGILLPPSLAFLQRLKDVVPPDSDIVLSTLTSFLDDFLVNVFHPQLDESLMDLCTRTFIELDAFQQDPGWANHAKSPILKGTTAFFNLISAFCKMLDNIPHDQAFTQLIITQMVTYYDKCCGWYKALVTKSPSQLQEGSSRLRAAAAITEPGELRDILTRLWDTVDGDESRKEELIQKEIEDLLRRNKDAPLDAVDIIGDNKTIGYLCMLYTSMEWLAARVGRLRHISDRSNDSTRREPGKPGRPRRWTLLNSPRPQGDETKTYLPMTQESAVTFDGVVNSYRELATTALFTLHLEIRCQAIQKLSQVFQNTHKLEQAVNEADPTIIALNSNLVTFDETISTYVGKREHQFITNSLGRLLDTLLIHSPTRIPVMNMHGCERMQLNILVLQQNLKNIETEDDVSLARSSRFFDLFVDGPDAIVERARKASASASSKGPNKDQNQEQNPGLEFTYDELKALVELCYSEGLTSERREASMQAKRKLNDCLLGLSEHLWQT